MERTVSPRAKLTSRRFVVQLALEVGYEVAGWWRNVCNDEGHARLVGAPQAEEAHPAHRVCNRQRKSVSGPTFDRCRQCSGDTCHMQTSVKPECTACSTFDKIAAALCPWSLVRFMAASTSCSLTSNSLILSLSPSTSPRSQFLTDAASRVCF